MGMEMQKGRLNMDELQRWYCSQTTAVIVKTPLEVVREAFRNLFYNGFADFKWKVVWC